MVAMERPVSLNPEHIRNEKVKVGRIAICIDSVIKQCVCFDHHDML